MKRLVSTRNLSKEDWLHYRKCGITGTDAGAILAWPNLLAINLLNLNEMDHLRSEQGSRQITLCIAS